MKTITKTLRLLTVLFLLISGKNAFSQGCTASFNYSIGANGAVTFSSTSVPVNSITTQYYWTFGNGAPTFTTVGNPTASQTYTANGTYTVTLFFLTPATCSNQATSVITITNASSCNQVANFNVSYQPNGLVLFTNTTTNTLVSTTYAWAFGDGGTSTAISPGHTYANNGAYTVTLTATTGTCISNKITLINVTNICNLVANFGYSFGANGLVTFTSTSVGTNSLSTYYYWNFGNGVTASGFNMTNASATYTANGTYVVMLKDSTFVPPCINSITYTITVTNVTGNPCNLNANFTSTQPGGGVVNFNNTSTGTSGGVTYAWAFGDGGTSTSASPAHTYANSGAYTVTLTANNNYSYACAATKTAVVNVNLCNLNANFTYSMAPNGQVNFYNTSSGTSSITSFAWTFGTGQTSSATNPSNTYTANGTYLVILTISNGPACNDSIGQVINVTNITGPCNLVASFSSSVGVGGSVNFASTSLGTNGSTTYFWNYGDGFSGSGANVNHTYSSSGNYLVVLTAINGSTLCVNSASQSVNITGIACVANANFTMSPTIVPQFWTATPSFPWNVTSAVWNWGDGSSSNLLYTSHTYSAAGMYNICLTVTVSCGSSASTCATYSISRMASGIIQVNVIEPELVEVGIQNIDSSPLDANIYPNPSNGEFTIHLNGLSHEKVGISIYNLLGEKIYASETEAVNGELIKEMQIGQVPNGIYVLRINSQNKTYSQKIMFDK